MRDGATVNLTYTSTNPWFNGGTANSAVAGSGGSVAASAYGQDIFLMSGGNLVFNLSTGVILNIPTAIEADNLDTNGGLTLNGPGTLVLNGTSSYGYTGGTLIQNAGTIQIGNNAALGIATGPLIFDSGTLQTTASFSSARPIYLEGNGTIDTFGNDLTLTGIIFGNSVFTGGLTKINAGTLTLTGTNSYIGGTSINDGILSVVSDANLGDPSGNLSIDSATLRMTGNFSSSRLINIGGTATLDTQGSTVSFSGLMSGTGTVIKRGAGTLTYSGLAPITIAAQASQGTLVVNGSMLGTMSVAAGATLRGSGTVGTLTNLGTVFPGNSIGTLAVLGNYVQHSAATYAVEIDGLGNGDLLNVSGSATLTGALNVFPLSGPYLKGTSYTIVQAGSVTGAFTTFNVDEPGLQLAVRYSPTQVRLEVLNNLLFNGQNITEYNPLQVSNYLHSLTYTNNTDLFNVVNILGGLTGGSLVTALDKLHPSLFGALDLINANTTSFVAALFNRHEAEKCCYYLEDPCGWTNLCGWIQPFGYLMNQKPLQEQQGFDGKARGILTGIEYCFPNSVLIGLGGGYTYTQLDWTNNYGNGSIKSGYMGVYGDYLKGRFCVDLSALYGVNYFEGSRHIAFSTIDRRAKNHHRGESFTAHGGISFDLLRLQKENVIKPFLDIDYICLLQHSFTEKGAQSLNLAVEGKNSQMLRSEAGLEWTRSIRVNEACFAPSIWLSYVNECFLAQDRYTASFQGIDEQFKVRNFTRPYNFVSPGIDFSWMLDEGMALSLAYSAELSRSVTTQKADLRFEWQF